MYIAFFHTSSHLNAGIFVKQGTTDTSLNVQSVIKRALQLRQLI